jgi:hypothetical protein
MEVVLKAPTSRSHGEEDARPLASNRSISRSSRCDICIAQSDPHFSIIHGRKELASVFNLGILLRMWLVSVEAASCRSRVGFSAPAQAASLRVEWSPSQVKGANTKHSSTVVQVAEDETEANGCVLVFWRRRRLRSLGCRLGVKWARLLLS